MSNREALSIVDTLKLALEALRPISHNSTDDPRGQADKAIKALEEALTKPEQRSANEHLEPVAIRLSNGRIDVLGSALVPIGTLLYITPPQRTWVGLTDDEIDSINYTSAHMLAREVEAKLKEKNT